MKDADIELFKAALNLLVSLLVLGLGWFVGQRFTLRWNLVQKWRETEIANVQQFYALYGEFKEVSKIWRIIKKNNGMELGAPKDIRWSLLARACAVESKNETIMIKIATERHLEPKELTNLGLFRQAIQKLRENIRDDLEIEFSNRGPEYDFFNELATRVGLIISSTPRNARLDLSEADARLKAITRVRKGDFDDALDNFKLAHPESQ